MKMLSKRRLFILGICGLCGYLWYRDRCRLNEALQRVQGADVTLAKVRGQAVVTREWTERNEGPINEHEAATQLLTERLLPALRQTAAEMARFPDKNNQPKLQFPEAQKTDFRGSVARIGRFPQPLKELLEAGPDADLDAFAAMDQRTWDAGKESEKLSRFLRAVAVAAALRDRLATELRMTTDEELERQAESVLVAASQPTTTQPVATSPSATHATQPSSRPDPAEPAGTLELYEAVSAYLGSTSPILKTLGDYYQAREFTDAALACHIMRCVTEQVQPTTRPFVNPLTERPGPLVVAPIPEVGQVQPPEKSTFLTWGDGSELGTPRILYCPVKPGGPGILELWYRYRDRWRYFGYVDKQEEADRITGGASGKKARACVSVEPERGDVSAVILLRDRADNLWHLISSQLRVKWDAYPGTTP